MLPLLPLLVSPAPAITGVTTTTGPEVILTADKDLEKSASLELDVGLLLVWLVEVVVATTEVTFWNALVVLAKACDPG